VNVPSYQVKAGDVVALREKAKKQLRVQSALALAAQRGEAEWIDFNSEKMKEFSSQLLSVRTCLPRSMKT